MARKKLAAKIPKVSASIKKKGGTMANARKLMRGGMRVSKFAKKAIPIAMGVGGMLKGMKPG
jgi:hypothetical protein